MNLLLLEDGDFTDAQTAVLSGRRALHVREVLRASEGQLLRVGKLQGMRGKARLRTWAADACVLDVTLDEAAPPRPQVDLLLALPRPKALKRLLPTIASLGLDRLILLNAARVEKSYFDSPVLSPGRTEALMKEGLEQAQDTVLPHILVRDRFRPFVEDELPGLTRGADAWVAHPAPQVDAAFPVPGTPRRTVLAVGPEGGWVPFELQLLLSTGFRTWSLGPRTLRTEVVVPYLLGQLAQR